MIGDSGLLFWATLYSGSVGRGILFRGLLCWEPQQGLGEAQPKLNLTLFFTTKSG